MASHQSLTVASIRALTPSESEQAYTICCESQPFPWSLKTFQDCFTSPYFALGHFHEKVLTGYAIGLVVVDEVTLMDIAVSSNFRRKGIGDALLIQFYSRAKALGATNCWLEVRSSNTPAIALYEQQGFATEGIRKNYYPVKMVDDSVGKVTAFEDAIMMRKTFE